MSEEIRAFGEALTITLGILWILFLISLFITPILYKWIPLIWDLVSDKIFTFLIKVQELSVLMNKDKQKTNTLNFYPTDENGKRIDIYCDDSKPVFEVHGDELEVRDIEDIALLMKEETFEKFCETWKMYHGKGE